MKSLIVCAGLMFGLFSLTSQAAARSDMLIEAENGQHSVSVSYADLDLSRAPGAAILANRVRAAARQVCGPEPSSPLDFAGRKSFDHCVDGAAGAALAALNRPQVASAYDSRR